VSAGVPHPPSCSQTKTAPSTFGVTSGCNDWSVSKIRCKDWVHEEATWPVVPTAICPRRPYRSPPSVAAQRTMRVRVRRRGRIRPPHVSPARQRDRGTLVLVHVAHRGTAYLTGGSVRPPGCRHDEQAALPLVLTGQLLALVARRWALRVAECPYGFTRTGARGATSGPRGWPRARPSACPGPSFTTSGAVAQATIAGRRSLRT
jgi:hypothetical protein